MWSWSNNREETPHFQSVFRAAAQASDESDDRNENRTGEDWELVLREIMEEKDAAAD